MILNLITLGFCMAGLYIHVRVHPAPGFLVTIGAMIFHLLILALSK